MKDKIPLIISVFIVLSIGVAIIFSLFFIKTPESAEAKKFLREYSKVNNVQISISLESTKFRFTPNESEFTKKTILKNEKLAKKYEEVRDEFLKEEFVNEKYQKLQKQFAKMDKDYSGVMLDELNTSFYYGIFNRSSTYSSDSEFYERFEILTDSEDEELREIAEELIEEYSKNGEVSYKSKEKMRVYFDGKFIKIDQAEEKYLNFMIQTNNREKSSL